MQKFAVQQIQLPIRLYKKMDRKMFYPIDNGMAIDDRMTIKWLSCTLQYIFSAIRHPVKRDKGNRGVSFYQVHPVYDETFSKITFLETAAKSNEESSYHETHLLTKYLHHNIPLIPVEVSLKNLTQDNSYGTVNTAML